jgi:segregation and condensation protein A
VLEIRIEPGHRAEQTTLVRMQDFDGPLGLLLSLIEARRLDVLTVPLGALAGAYLEALAALPVERLANVSAFVAVASQLILIKSQALLPRPSPPAGPIEEDGPDPEAQLRQRLLVYRAHREAGRRLEEGVGLGRLFRREPAAALAAARAGARAPAAPPLPAESLGAALAVLARISPASLPLPETLPRTVAIEQRVEIIRAALRHADAIVLQQLLVGIRDRVVRAVTFLALLELVKRREVTVEQAEPFGPIVARARQHPAPA